jgi:hypothetical protein
MAVYLPEAEKPAKVMEAVEAILAVPFAQIPALEVWWLWKGLVPMRHLTIMVAPGKTGKGITAIDFIARVTTGRSFPGDNDDSREPQQAIIIAPEDDANEAVRWRLNAAGADVTRVWNLTTYVDDSGELRQFLLPESLEVLRKTIAAIEKQTGERVGIVVIDPLLAITTTTIANDRAARAITGPLEAMAKQPLEYDPLDPDNEDAVHPGLSIVLTHHTVASGKTAGSVGLVNSVRMVLRLERQQPKNSAHPGRVLYVEATNITDAQRREAYWLGGDEQNPYLIWRAEQQSKPKGTQAHGYTTTPKAAPKPPVTVTDPKLVPPGAQAMTFVSESDPAGIPLATSSPGPMGSKPYRLAMREQTQGAQPVNSVPESYESVAAAMAAAEKVTGQPVTWVQKRSAEGKTGYRYLTAKWGKTGHTFSFAIWDKREQELAKQAGKG